MISTVSTGTVLVTAGMPCHEALIAEHAYSAEALLGVSLILYFRLPPDL